MSVVLAMSDFLRRSRDLRLSDLTEAIVALRRLGEIGERLDTLIDYAPRTLGPPSSARVVCVGDEVDELGGEIDLALERLSAARAELAPKEKT